MTTSVSRDLLLLAAVAFQNKKYDSAGSLFASALSSDDASEFLQSLDVLEKSNLSTDLVEEAGMSLSQVAKEIARSMGQEATASDEDPDEDADEDIEDQEDEDQDQASSMNTAQLDEDDQDDQEILPSSISKDYFNVRLVIDPAVGSPIKVKPQQ